MLCVPFGNKREGNQEMNDYFPESGLKEVSKQFEWVEEFFVDNANLAILML
jgi:hypothetical protein